MSSTLRTGRMLNRYAADVSTRTFVPLDDVQEAIASAVQGATCLSGTTPNPPHETWTLVGLDRDSAYEFVVVDLAAGTTPPTDAQVRDVLLDPNRGPLWTGRFRTSRYARFAEHLASFGSVGGKVAATTPLPASGLITKLRLWVRANGQDGGFAKLRVFLNGSATSFTCTINVSGPCTVGSSEAFVDGDEIAIRVENALTQGGSPTGIVFSYGMEVQ